jgi:hypothetical protein
MDWDEGDELDRGTRKARDLNAFVAVVRGDFCALLWEGQCRHCFEAHGAKSNFEMHQAAGQRRGRLENPSRMGGGIRNRKLHA